MVIGKFMTYYRSPHAFAPHETDLAVTIARQVGFSIERARAEQARQVAEEEMRASEERFRLMSERAPVMIWISDSQGRCVRLNAMLRDFWGVSEEGVARFDWRDTMHPEDEARITGRMVDATMNQAEVTVKGRYRNADGAYRILETHAKPHFAADGAFLGLIGVNVDVTEREESESRLRQSEERFRLAVEAAPSAMVMTDGAGRVVLSNAQAEHLFGFSREELAARNIAALIPEAHPEAAPRPLGGGEETRAIRKDGSEVPVEVGLSPIEMSGGSMTLASIVDISYRKQAESQRELLLAELNHRVKNTLAVVQSVAHQTFRDNQTSPDARAAFEGRLVALATAHNLLTQANWKGASLERVASDVLQVRDANQERVTLMGPDVALQPKEALAIAMALHELCTNATKYGALSNAKGHVSVEWAWMDVPNGLRLVWRERSGPPVKPPTRRGFGSRLVERTVEQDLDGEIAMDFREDGLICSMEAHLPRLAGGL
jgi:PAS domain S-box-containing protein